MKGNHYNTSGNSNIEEILKTKAVTNNDPHMNNYS